MVLPERDDHDEILRLRERLHSMESDLLGLKFQTSDLREWRAEARGQLAALRKEMDGVMTADEIADAVARRRANAWTLWQKLGAGCVGVATFATLVHTWV